MLIWLKNRLRQGQFEKRPERIFPSLISAFFISFRFGSVVEDEFKELVTLEKRYSLMIQARRRSLVLSLTGAAKDYENFEVFLGDVGNYYLEMKFKHAPLKEEGNRNRYGGQYALYMSGDYSSVVKGSRIGKLIVCLLFIFSSAHPPVL